MAEAVSTSPPAARPVTARIMELSPDGLRRRFLLVVPAAHVLAERDRRLQEIGQAAQDWSEPVRARLAESALVEACRRAGDAALAQVLPRLGLAPVGAPRLDALAGPPDGDLILRAEVWTMPEVRAPDPATLRIERLVTRPDAAEVERATAALAAGLSRLAEVPPGTPAEAGDELGCDIAATLLPAENRIPQPSLRGAELGRPGRLPEGWSFGDNGAGLAHEVLEVAAGADPPHLRLRVHGTAATDGQSFVIFHPARSIAVDPGASWVGSVAVRPVGPPTGLRGAKLRLQSQPDTGEGSLRRKDSALRLVSGSETLVRCYVSDKMIEPGTAFLRMPLLFDHAAGEVDFTLDIAAPRLVEGLDLGDAGAVPLPEFSGRGRRIVAGAADGTGLAARLLGVRAGESREIALRLPHALEDRALAGRQALFSVRVASVQRRLPPPLDDALARSLGFADLVAMRAAVAERVALGHRVLSERQARRALLDALLAAAGEIPLPRGAVLAELAALWPQLAEAARKAGEEPPSQPAAMALAARRLRISLLLGAVARQHGLEPSPAELEEAAGAERAAPEARQRVGEERAIAFLMARARVTERIVTSAELAARAGG